MTGHVAAAEAPADSIAADHVVVRIGEARFALPLSILVEVIRTPEIARLPSAPPGVLGVIAIREEIYPLLDLGHRLTGASCARGARVLLTGAVEKGRVAVLVDGVEEVVDIAGTDLSPTPGEATRGLDERHIRGIARVGERSVAVLGETAVTIEPERRDDGG